MIPGAWELRRRPGFAANRVEAANVVESRALTPNQPVASQSGSRSDTERPEPSSWLKVSIFAGTLLAAMWLAMTVFFD